MQLGKVEVVSITTAFPPWNSCAFPSWMEPSNIVAFPAINVSTRFVALQTFGFYDNDLNKGELFYLTKFYYSFCICLSFF